MTFVVMTPTIAGVDGEKIVTLCDDEILIPKQAQNRMTKFCMLTTECGTT